MSSNIQYHRTRLKEAFECLVDADQYDGPTQRNCMYTIMSCCNELRLDLNGYLKEKYVERYKQESSEPTHNGKQADYFEADITREYLCHNCGKGFSTKQARAGHLPHCKKVAVLVGTAKEGGEHA